MYIFLDDIRQPEEAALYMQPRIGVDNLLYVTKEWLIVRNYKDFVKAIEMLAGQITHISFDHDLADIHYNPATWTESFKYHEETGLDCAKFFKEFYDSKELEYPILFVHSMNPIGTENIINLFK